MAKKSISTLTKIYPSAFSKRKKIRIAQPEYRDLHLRKRDVVRWDAINLREEDFVLHRRGVRRIRVGEDPLEARAVPKESLNGTLPERILYKYLTDYMRFVSGVDFTFQSSLEGGRLELGGIVVDFLFPFMKIIIQVQGPTHNAFLRSRRDEEQMGDLNKMGFTVFAIEDTIIYDEYLFEETMRRMFALPNGVGGSGGAHGAYEGEETNIDKLYNIFEEIQDSLIFQFGV